MFTPWIAIGNTPTWLVAGPLETPLAVALRLAGVGMVVTAFACPYICNTVLGLRGELDRIEPVARRLAVTFERYIQGVTLAFGGLCLALPHTLLVGDPLSLVLTGGMAVYWGVKVAMEAGRWPAYRRYLPTDAAHQAGAVALAGVFVFQAVVTAAAFAANLHTALR